MELKEEGKKALGVAIGVAVVTGVALLLVYLGNYGFSQYTNYQGQSAGVI